MWSAVTPPLLNQTQRAVSALQKQGQHLTSLSALLLWQHKHQLKRALLRSTLSPFCFCFPLESVNPVHFCTFMCFVAKFNQSKLDLVHQFMTHKGPVVHYGKFSVNQRRLKGALCGCDVKVIWPNSVVWAGLENVLVRKRGRQGEKVRANKKVLWATG